ncbi:MAG: AEC family transporter [Bradyrhizobiaceae bacterium]|nr:AEC family transporter [Bradyrhizobiaceae bacterium]
MADVLSLALPFFGLIVLGFVSGRIVKLPESGLAWLNFFILYIALPPLFFQLVSRTPFEQLANPRFVLATTSATAITFALALGVGIWLRRGNLPEATIAGIVGAYANIGYMGPGLTLAAFGTAAAVPTALIFTFDSTFFFAAVPFLMALSGVERKSKLATALTVVQRVLTHPFIVATIIGVFFAWLEMRPPAWIDKLLDYLANAAAPCALFTLGVTVALRPLKRVPDEIPILVGMKLFIHPLIAWLILSAFGGFDPVWVYTAVLMAALPPALNAYIMARQYDAYIAHASGGILVGTIASIVTVTGLLYLIQHGILAPGAFN